MNTFNPRKIYDAIVWRYRAWYILENTGYQNNGRHLLFNYWSSSLLESIESMGKSKESAYILEYFVSCLKEANYNSYGKKNNSNIHKIIDKLLHSASQIKIATVSTQDAGGAAIGSLRRIKALRQLGLNVNLLSLINGVETNSTIQLIPSSRFKIKSSTNQTGDIRKLWQDNIVVRRKDYPGLKANELFSKTKSVIDFNDNINLLDDCDILHLHWVAGVFDYKNTHLLSEKPIVWTLADMNAFTGGCHYSEGCSEYMNECNNCPLLGKEHAALAHKAWMTKKAAYAKLKNLEIICPSEWLATRVKQSSLLKDRTVHVIPNPAPTDEFTLINKRVARSRLGLDITKQYILFGADNLKNVRKGGDIFLKALELLSVNDNVEVITFGSSDLKLSIPTNSLGKLHDTEMIALAYSAADVYAFPSREDNAPLTVMESLLCGTPVVGFNVGNIPEVIKHKENGFIAENYSPKSFAKGLKHFLRGKESSKADTLSSLRKGNLCRITVSDYHDPKKSAERHKYVYENLLM